MRAKIALTERLIGSLAIETHDAETLIESLAAESEKANPFIGSSEGE